MTVSGFSARSVYDALAIVKGVALTHREIDVIACLLSGKGTKSIAALLSVSPRTVETHVRNIMLKYDSNSRDEIIVVVEKAGQLDQFKNIYWHLLQYSSFRLTLQKIANLHKHQSRPKFVIYAAKQQAEYEMLGQLVTYLKLTGVNVSVDAQTPWPITLPDTPVVTAIVEKKADDCQEAVYLALLNSAADGTYKINSVNINFNNEYQEGLYFSVFAVLKKILPASMPLDALILDFHKTVKSLQGNNTTQQQLPKNTQNYILGGSRFSFSRKNVLVIGSLVCVFFSSVATMFYLYKHHRHVAHSSLSLPHKQDLLNRLGILERIEETFNAQASGIKSIVLVGYGGAGKTTLSRQYSSSQKEAVIWEINAENKETILRSLQDLAYAMSQSAEDKKELVLINQSCNQAEREMQIIIFIQRHLKENSPWLLIYDNVENLSAIKHLLPDDQNLWGSGRIIISTRDLNSQHTSYIEPKNIIHVDELTKAEAATLFAQIYYSRSFDQLTLPKQKEALIFLQKIPSFPLDVTIAAYYLKNANITFEQYLENIKVSTIEFAKHQEALLANVNHYTKARYSVVKVSLEKIVKNNEDFKKLAALICLLDSQHIPREFLESCQDKLTVDEFTYQLKKHGLLTQFSTKSFSLHRSTQEMGRVFFKDYLSEQEKVTLANGIIRAIQSFEELHQDVKSFHDFYQKITTNYEKRILLLPHIESLLDNLEEFSLPLDIKEKVKQHLWLLGGGIHKACSHNMILAKQYLSKLFATDRMEQDIPANIKAIMLLNLGAIELDLGDAGKSILYFEKALSLCKKLEKTDILQTEILKMLGVTYADQGCLDKANQYFAQAIKVLMTIADSISRRESLSEIYAQQAFAYSKQYIVRDVKEVIKKYMQQSLELLGAAHSFRKTQESNAALFTHYTAKQKWRGGQIYNRLCLYQESLAFLEDATYILDQVFWTNFFLEAEIYADMGEALLRTGKISSAEKLLTKSLKISERVLGPTAPCTWHAKVHRAEAYVRLGKLDLAYRDCMDVMQSITHLPNLNSQLLYMECQYHAAVIAYKQQQHQEAQKHFLDFYQNISNFCKEFLPEDLIKHVLTENGSKKIIVDFQKCLAIFTAIYGRDHPFVKDYAVCNVSVAD